MVAHADERAYLQDALWIRNKAGTKLVQFDAPHSEQLELDAALTADGVRLVYVLKSRQIGASTEVCGYVYADTWLAESALRTLTVSHTRDGTAAQWERYQLFHRELPARWKRSLAKSNDREIVFADTGAGLRCETAGRSGGRKAGERQGRSWSYQRLVAEELAFWPDAEGVWAATTSALDEESPWHQVIVLTTGNGPGNVAHRVWRETSKAAQGGDPTVRALFFPWFRHAAYARTPSSGWEPMVADANHVSRLGLSPAQAYWREQKIHGPKGIGLQRFRREYPETPEDPFLVFEGSFFDLEALNRRLLALPDVAPGELRVFRKPERGMVYAGGVDPSWCTGGDDAVATILDAMGRQCAVLATNQGGDERFAQLAVDLAMAYNARMLVEANPGGAGRNVIRAMERAKVKLWRGENPGKPTEWTTGRGAKEEGYGHLRRMLEVEEIEVNDPTTLRQTMGLRLLPSGGIEGPGGHEDDHPMALMLAAWNLRTLRNRFGVYRPDRTGRLSRGTSNPFEATR